ncbi:hypothetical protein WKY82_20445 [Gordonia malaquae]|uniref:hypothetical protein n=1 Tax=Gordonia malaquae TaxID=410332 RepID=UPI0030C7987A
MKRILTAVLALAAVASFSACSSDDTTSDSTTAPAETTATTATTTTTKAKVWTLDEISSTVQGLGYDCSAQTGYIMCTKGSENWQIKVPAKGDGDVAFRTAACEGGMISNAAEKEVLTNGSTLVVFAGNDGQDLEAFASKLDGAGITGLEVEKYCP